MHAGSLRWPRSWSTNSMTFRTTSCFGRRKQLPRMFDRLKSRQHGLKPDFIMQMMSPDLLPAVATFACVAHHASFTRAAAELGLSPSALSQSVRALESRLGVRLLERSTRHVGLTELGRRFLQQAAPGLAAMSAALDGLNESRDKPAGVLRLNLSQTAAQIAVLPHLADFAAAYPDITLDLHCENEFTDLVTGNFDAGIRLGEKVAEGMVAVPLGGRLRLATVAAPRYLQSHEVPQTPEDLRGHRCLQVRLPSGLYRWKYAKKVGRKNRELTVETHGPVVVNDGALLLTAALAGVGVAVAMEELVAEDLAAGRLIPLLEPWWPSMPGFYLYHPTRVNTPRKLRAFIDFVQVRLAETPAIGQPSRAAPERTRTRR